MGRKAGTHPPAGLAHPGALCLWRWLRGIGFGWAGHLAAHPEFRPAASRACTSAPRPQPRSPSPHSCHSITPPSLLRAPEDPASSSLVEATCRAESFALEALPRPKSPPHTPRLPFSRRLGQPGLSANPCPAFKTLEILYRTAILLHCPQPFHAHSQAPCPWPLLKLFLLWERPSFNCPAPSGPRSGRPLALRELPRVAELEHCCGSDALGPSAQTRKSGWPGAASAPCAWRHPL